MVGRKRKHGPAIKHVVLSRGWLFYAKGKPWVKLARDGDLPGMHKALSDLLAGNDAGTMAPIFDRYEREVLPAKAPKTRKDQGKQLKPLRAVFGHMRPGAITAVEVRRYLRERKAKTAADREIALLSHVFTMAMDWEMAPANPCLGVPRNNVEGPRKLPDALSMMLLWGLASRRLRAYMALAYVTGQRPADVLKLREAHFTYRGLDVTQNKTGTELLVKWTPNLRAAHAFALKMRPITPLTRHMIVNERGQPVTVGAMRQEWKKLTPQLIAAGGKPFPMKNLRARSATDHKDGAHLGHKDERVLAKHYRLKAREVTPI